MKFYTCKNDKCFKCVFLNPNNQDLLSLMIKETTLNEYNNITISNIERNINTAIRRKYLDLLLDSKEATVNIEVNGFNKKYIHPRNTSFICDCYSNYTLVNKEYTEDKDIIQINFSYGIKGNIPIRKYMIMDKHKKKFVKNFIIYEVNIDYCLQFWYNRNKQEVDKKENLKNIIKYKYYIMLSLNLKELKELINLTKDERIVKYMEELKKVNNNPKFREYITEEQDKEFILNSVRTEGRLEGEKIGETRGQKIGEARGQKIGEARGEKKGALKNKFDTAKKMLRDKVNINTVSKYTGLTLSQIKNISL